MASYSSSPSLNLNLCIANDNMTHYHLACHTAYCILHTAYCILHTAYCILHTAYCILLQASPPLQTRGRTSDLPSVPSACGLDHVRQPMPITYVQYIPMRLAYAMVIGCPKRPCISRPTALLHLARSLAIRQSYPHVRPRPLLVVAFDSTLLSSLISCDLLQHCLGPARCHPIWVWVMRLTQTMGTSCTSFLWSWF